MVSSSVVTSMRKAGGLFFSHLSLGIKLGIFLLFYFGVLSFMLNKLLLSDWFSSWMYFLKLKFSFLHLFFHNILKILFFFDFEEWFLSFILFHIIQKLLLFFHLFLFFSFLLLTILIVSLFQSLMSFFFHLFLKLFMFHSTLNLKRFHFLLFSSPSFSFLILLFLYLLYELLSLFCSFTQNMKLISPYFPFFSYSTWTWIINRWSN